MIGLAFVLIFILSAFSATYAEDIYVTGKTLGENGPDSSLPPYLRYPNDAISEMMFGGKMKEIINTSCNYKFMLYTEIADETPHVEGQEPPFDKNEIHYYFKDGQPNWYSISTMKHESVRRNSVRSWVERADNFAFAVGAYDIALQVPEPRRGQEYKAVAAYYIGQEELYNQLHGFDESHIYCRVFYLGGQLYKKFILVAKKDDWSWRAELNFPSKTEEIIPPDFVPAGQTFGKFYPLNQ